MHISPVHFLSILNWIPTQWWEFAELSSGAGLFLLTKNTDLFDKIHVENGYFLLFDIWVIHTLYILYKYKDFLFFIYYCYYYFENMFIFILNIII